MHPLWLRFVVLVRHRAHVRKVLAAHTGKVLTLHAGDVLFFRPRRTLGVRVAGLASLLVSEPEKHTADDQPNCAHRADHNPRDVSRVESPVLQNVVVDVVACGLAEEVRYLPCAEAMWRCYYARVAVRTAWV